MHAFYALVSVLTVAVFAIPNSRDSVNALVEHRSSNNGELNPCSASGGFVPGNPSNLATDGAVQAGDSPAYGLYSRSLSNIDTVDFRKANDVSGTETPVTFDVGDVSELSTIADTLYHIAQTQACSIWSCSSMFPKTVCIAKAIATAGEASEVWKLIKKCGVTAKLVWLP
jgi:hypothetical protein